VVGSLVELAAAPNSTPGAVEFGIGGSTTRHTGRVQVLSEHASRLENVLTYEARGTSAVRLAAGYGEAHAYLLQFEAGGAIGRHEAGYGQLLIILTGQGWVSGHDGFRAEVAVGDVVLFDRGEQHAKGSDTGMTAVMVQVRDLAATDAALD
jgi:quercetin dioxygenase-like cupin family protein